MGDPVVAVWGERHVVGLDSVWAVLPTVSVRSVVRMVVGAFVGSVRLVHCAVTRVSVWAVFRIA